MPISESLIAETSQPKKIPRAHGIPIFGNLFELQKDIIGFFVKLKAANGDICRFNVLGDKVYLVSNPEWIERILVRDNDKFEKDKGLKILRKHALGVSLLTSEGEEHKTQRRQSAKAFSRKNIHSYAADMVQIAGECLADWKDGATRDVHADMTALTAKIAAQTLFHSRVDAKVERIGRALGDILELSNYMIQPLPDIIMALPFPLGIKIKKALADLDEIIYEFIDEHLRPDAPPPSDFLGMLIQAKAEAGADFGQPAVRKGLRDEALTIFLAGHETTANALAWSLYLLAHNPRAASAVRAEAKEILKTKKLDSDALTGLRFTRAAVAESMRLFPPAWVIGRMAKADYDLDGYIIPKNCEIWMSQYLMHRDPRWFDRPEEFIPERWLGPEQRLPNFAYFPFGGGPRACIGEQFAWMEATLILARIYSEFDLRPVSNEPPKLEALITLRPHGGLKMKIARADVTFGEGGLTENILDSDRDRIRDIAYEGRGGA